VLKGTQHAKAKAATLNIAELRRLSMGIPFRKTDVGHFNFKCVENGSRHPAAIMTQVS
jgi:hypothetical protein